ncbi:MAG: tripartite tricarboxylate transporter substrate binding protein [Rhodospirillales bacterium]|nr:tripartite tricarboxylate transporter substrate binding protein [Rhodospirillales bacterium]
MAFIAGAFAFSAVVASVPAQVMAAYPEKPIKVIVGWSAGGGADTFVRTVGKYTEKYLGAAFQPVYKKGGGGTVALNELTKNFDPDGYTIAIGIIPHQVIPTQLSDVGYKLSDLRWLATFAKVPNGVYVRHDSPYQTMKQLIAAAKAAPGKLKAALPDPRSGNTVFFNTWLSLSKIDIAPLYYGGGSKMLKAMLGKEVDMMITNANWAIRKPDDTHLLGLAADKRFALVPKVQTFHELGIDLEDFSVRTFVASAKVPGDRVKVLVEGLRKRSARIQPSRRTWRKSA